MRKLIFVSMLLVSLSVLFVFTIHAINDDALIGEMRKNTYDKVPEEVQREVESIMGEVDFDNWNRGNVESSIMDGDVIHCCNIIKNDDGSFTISFWDVSANAEFDEDHTKLSEASCDFNDDGKVNARDVIGLMKYIVESKDNSDLFKADVNGDASVNARDVIAVMKFIVSKYSK